MAYPRHLQRTRFLPPSTLNATDGRPALKFGDSGPEVEDLQGALTAAGFDASKDSPGSFGSATLTALMAFQTAKGIASFPPVATEQTWEALFPTRKGGGTLTMNPLAIEGNTGIAVLGVLAAGSVLWIWLRMRSKRFMAPAMSGLTRRRRARR